MTTPADGRSERRDRPMVFVDDLEHPVLDTDDHHHLARALRLTAGTPITVGDGAGRWRRVVFDPLSAGLVLDTTGDVMEEPAPAWSLTVAFTPVKGDRPEWTVQKLTELGIDRIVPILTERSVVRWDAKRGEKQAAKWRRIGREASMQSRRVRLPIIDDLTPFESLTVDAGVEREGGAVLADPEGDPLGSTDRFVLIGPEGGWAPSERSSRRLVSLPGGVLRAETAALTAAAIMVLHRDRGSAKQN